jgi:hypothetical protein
MADTRASHVPLPKRPRFWIAPLLAGSCFALGYGITHRMVTLQGTDDRPKSETFDSLDFPGSSLQSLRSRNPVQGTDLQVDMVAIEALEAVDRSAKQVAEEQAAEARRADLALQPPVEPAWTAPAWSDPDLPLNPAPTADPLPTATQSPAAVPPPQAAPAVLLTPAVQDAATEAMPAPEPPVLVSEPDPVLAPVTEPVLEAMEPVSPPIPPPEP